MGLYSNDLVQDQLSKAKKHLVKHIPETLEENLAYMIEGPSGQETFASPIEAVFWLWWQVRRYVTPDSFSPIRLRLREQVSVSIVEKNYRFDFVVEEDPSPMADSASVTAAANRYGLPIPKIGVELDGHDFHERTKEQVTHRNQRDRDLQMAGWQVFHFSGSELVRKPTDCIDAVFEYADGKFFDLYVDVHRRWVAAEERQA